LTKRKGLNKVWILLVALLFVALGACGEEGVLGEWSHLMSRGLLSMSPFFFGGIAVALLKKHIWLVTMTAIVCGGISIILGHLYLLPEIRASMAEAPTATRSLGETLPIILAVINMLVLVAFPARLDDNTETELKQRIDEVEP
jgi:hypothetical protein